MGLYILTMSCVSGDAVQVAIHKREDIVWWLKTLDHEGSSWDVVHHRPNGDIDFVTEAIMAEYGEIN